MCFTGGHGEGLLLRQQVYLQLQSATSRDVVKLRENKVHLSEQVARVTNPRLINNSLQWSLLSSAQWRVHHPSGHRGNYSLQRIRIYIKARINECTNIYGVTSNVQYKAHALLQNWTSFRYSWGVEEDQNTVSIQSLGTFLRISSGLSHSQLPFCFATSATRIGKTLK